MTYKDAKRISLANFNLKFKITNVYSNTGSFSKQYMEAKKSTKKMSKA